MNLELLDEFPLEACTPFLRFSEESYVRILLKRTDAYDIFAICWKRGQTTPIHDHPSDGCWMRVLSGALQETEYSYPDLVAQETHTLRVGDAGFKQGTVVLHAITALEDSVSVHVYYPPCYVAKKYTPRT